MTMITTPELHGLLAIAQEEGLDMKPVLLRVLVDLDVGVANHTADEALQFREIASQMIPHVDEQTALVVACKLAAYPNTPPTLAESFIARADDSARITLGDAVWLPRHSMVNHAADADRLLAAAVAARADLDASLMRLLLSRDEAVIDVTLAGNTAVALPHDVKDELLARGRDEPAIATAMLARPDLTGADRAVHFAAADRAARNHIIDEAMRLSQISGRNRQQRRAPDALVSALENAAVSRDERSFLTVLALGLGTSPAKAEILLADRSGESLAIALAALGIDDETATRIFMFRDPLIGHSTQRVFALVELMRRVHWAAADRIVTAMLGLEGAPIRGSGPRPTAEPVPAAPRQAGSAPAATAQPAPATRWTA
jgi:hypothetical protein